jgi:hypothetical protein
LSSEGGATKKSLETFPGAVFRSVFMYDFLIVVIHGVLFFCKTVMLKCHDKVMCRFQLGMELVTLCFVNAALKRKYIIASFCLFFGPRKASRSFFDIGLSHDVIVEAVYRLALVSGGLIFGSVQANSIMWAA